MMGGTSNLNQNHWLYSKCLWKSVYNLYAAGPFIQPLPTQQHRRQQQHGKEATVLPVTVSTKAQTSAAHYTKAQYSDRVTRQGQRVQQLRLTKCVTVLGSVALIW